MATRAPATPTLGGVVIAYLAAYVAFSGWNQVIYIAGEVERPAHDSFDHAAVIAGEKTLGITIDQDIFYLGGMQAGMHSAGFERAVLNKDEVRIQHFHDWVDEALGKG